MTDEDILHMISLSQEFEQIKVYSCSFPAIIPLARCGDIE
jgi:hypothetical protein